MLTRMILLLSLRSGTVHTSIDIVASRISTFRHVMLFHEFLFVSAPL